jgi:hypothetical protein
MKFGKMLVLSVIFLSTHSISKASSNPIERIELGGSSGGAYRHITFFQNQGDGSVINVRPKNGNANPDSGAYKQWIVNQYNPNYDADDTRRHIDERYVGARTVEEAVKNFKQ